MSKHATQELSEEGKSRIEIMEEALNGECETPDCIWLDLALQVLDLNKIDRKEFISALHNLITLGRGKFRNLMIIGRSNCAKTFLIKPLMSIYKGKVFENPARDKYGWVGAQSASVIVLQAFRYSKELIAWSDMLLLLEGETVKLPSPKNHFVADIVIHSGNDVPIFATAPSKIEYSRYSVDFAKETEMMDSRWKVFEFTHIFKEVDQIKVTPCGHCFSKLVFMNEQ